MEQVYATIITIGDELLIGQVDTNSAWMAQELNKAGIWLKRRVSVGDNKEEIVSARWTKKVAMFPLSWSHRWAGILPMILPNRYWQNIFGGKLVVNQRVSGPCSVSLWKVFRRPFTEQRAANRPKCPMYVPYCTMKRCGTGMWFEKTGRSLYPARLRNERADAERSAAPFKTAFHHAFITHRTLLTASISESMLADVASNGRTVTSQLPSWPTCLITAWCVLRITASDPNNVLNQTLDDGLPNWKYW